MTPDALNLILKSVSRSFYLSIRILPSSMRPAIAIAYLLARAADSITDTIVIKTDEQSRLLRSLKVSLENSDKITSTQTEINKVISKIENDSEQKLLSKLSHILNIYHQMNDTEKLPVLNVVNTLTNGMLHDLETFNSDAIIALPDMAALDTYTYEVAGCVGEFWTIISIQNKLSLKNWDFDAQTALGIQFGKALQLTNILRDVAKDARLNRCYLPATLLDSYELNPEMLFNSQNDLKFRPVINQLIKDAFQKYESAQKYFLSIPRKEIRLRLAALWPILIGLETLNQLSGSENFPNENITIKVNRRWVYRMLLKSFFIVSSNQLVENEFEALRNSVLENIS